MSGSEYCRVLPRAGAVLYGVCDGSFRVRPQAGLGHVQPRVLTDLEIVPPPAYVVVHPPAQASKREMPLLIGAALVRDEQALATAHGNAIERDVLVDRRVVVVNVTLWSPL